MWSGIWKVKVRRNTNAMNGNEKQWQLSCHQYASVGKAIKRAQAWRSSHQVPFSLGTREEIIYFVLDIGVLLLKPNGLVIHYTFFSSNVSSPSSLFFLLDEDTLLPTLMALNSLKLHFFDSIKAMWPQYVCDMHIFHPWTCFSVSNEFEYIASATTP